MCTAEVEIGSFVFRMEGNNIFILYKNNTFFYFFEKNVVYEKPGF